MSISDRAMYPRLMSVGFVTATLFLGFSFTPVTLDRPAQAQTALNRKAEADRLFEAGRGQYRQGDGDLSALRNS